MAFLELLKTIGGPLGTLAKPLGFRNASDNIVVPIVSDDGILKVETVPTEITQDPFGRQRYSRSKTFFDRTHVYGKEPLYWEEILTGTGSATHNADESCIDMQVSASGDEVTRVSREHFRYQAGYGQLMFFTGAFGPRKADVEKEIGAYTASEGFSFRQKSDGIYIVKRSSVTGLLVETEIAQASWNLDPLDGSGPSGITLDDTKSQVMVLDYQWLGVGRVRMGFNFGNAFVYCHEFLHANLISTTYTGSGNLPVRYNIKQTGTGSGASEMKQICSSVQTEGGMPVWDLPGYVFSADIGPNEYSVTTGSRKHMISIRPKTTFGTKTNRGSMYLQGMSVFADDAVLIEVFHDSQLSGGTWTDVGTNSAAQFNISEAATLGSTDYKIYSEYSTRRAAIEFSGKTSKLPLTLSFDGLTAQNLSVTAQSVAGTQNVAVALKWKEIR